MNEEYKLEKRFKFKLFKWIETITPEIKYMKADKSKRIYNELLEVIDALDVYAKY